MPFRSFKNLTLGKPKEKREKEKVDVERRGVPTERIVTMESRTAGKTKDRKEKEPQIQEIADKAVKEEDVTQGPHRPLGELLAEPDANSTNLNTLTTSPISGESEKSGDKIKLVEVSAVNTGLPIKEIKIKPADASAVAPKPPEKEKEIKLDDSSDSLGKLFNQDEEEVNPLSSLINSLPDVTAQELIDDLKEIKRIIKEWQKK